MRTNIAHLYLLSPLHTGGASQEGNLVGIARETHTNLPYLPSSTIRGRLRAETDSNLRNQLWGNTLEDVRNPECADENLTQGQLWVGDGSILWFPVPSLSHGVVWVTSPFLLRRWSRLTQPNVQIPEPGSFSGGNNQNLYLKDAIFKRGDLIPWGNEWKEYLPPGSTETDIISQALVLTDRDCQVLIQLSLWQQVKIKLNENKNVDGGFRYEEAIPPETLMYFPWGTTTNANRNAAQAQECLKTLLRSHETFQIGGQESLGRGFVEIWTYNDK